jgi:hypothetical protein
VRIPIVLTVGLLLTALAVGVAAARSPLVLLGASSTRLEGGLAEIQSDISVCQAGEKLPAGTSAIRFAMGSAYGPSISIEARSGNRVITRGSRGGEWVGPTAVAVTPVAHAVSNVTVCFKVGTVTESTTLRGGKASRAQAATVAGHPLGGRTRIEYLRPGSKSFASLASTIAKHMGLGNASGGSRIVITLIFLMAAVIAVTSLAILGDLR